MKTIPYRLFFKAFSNETRLGIINTLRNGHQKNVTEICNELDFEQSRVSHNLSCLIDCGFVEVKRNGKERIYSLNKDTIKPMINLIDRHIKKYSKHLHRCGVLKR
ncbi:MAG: helix-turn-helix transcriptional regulator [Candidatus Aenigmarchaeota archaeon]|nr:helix-turn-helix transcriptional regulator [Candidatus Aenigmarchaeota archaeon]